jgi:hypothetical protein
MAPILRGVSRFRSGPHIAFQEAVMTGIVIGLLMLGNTVASVPIAELPAAELPMTNTAVVDAPTREDARPALRLPKDLLIEDGSGASRTWVHTAQTSSSGSSRTAKILGVAIGALGGFYAGGMLGYAIAQDRDRDDDGVSGLPGVMIGAPIGAILGAWAGYQLAK